MLKDIFIWEIRILCAVMLLSLPGITCICAGIDSRVEEMAVEVDLRPVFKKWNLPGRLQGGRGTCSVFAVVGAMEYAKASRHDKGLRLSVEYLNWASNEAVGKNQDGGFFSDLWKGYEEHGICSEPAMVYRENYDPELMPDEAAKEQAKQLSEENKLRMHWIKKWDPKIGLTEKEQADIKSVLSKGWPVCGGCRWPKKAEWKEKVLDMPGAEGVFDGHSILLVGYRDDPELPGGGVFMIRNSNTAGSGYKISYAYAAAYMNDAVWIE